MPDDSPQGGKIFGMPKKVAVPVLAVGGIIVVYVLVFRNRGGGGSASVAPPQEEATGGFFGGGGGGSPSLGQIIGAPPMNPWDEAFERLGFEREQFKYNMEQRREEERQRGFELEFAEKRSTLDAFLDLLPFQFETQKEREASLQAGFRADKARSGAAEAFYKTEQATEEVVERAVRKKGKVECPVGEHLVVTPEGARCQPLGGGGFNFKTVFSGIGNVAEGLFRGVAAAAPGIGYNAAQAGAAQAGVFPGGWFGAGTNRQGTPPIASAPRRHPYEFTGDTAEQFGGLA